MEEISLPPRDRVTINAWLRSFYMLEPIVNQIVDFSVECAQPEIDFSETFKAEPVFKKTLEALEEGDFMSHMLHDYFLLGESFAYGTFDEFNCNWDCFIPQNPDYIVVKKKQFFLRPSETLRSKVLYNPEDESLKNIDPTMIRCIEDGKNVPMDDFYLMSMIQKISSYEVRGTSQFIPYFRDFAGKSHLEEIPEFLKNMHPDYARDTAKIVFEKRINKARKKLAKILLVKVFTPVAKMNELYEYIAGEKVLLLPKIT